MDIRIDSVNKSFGQGDGKIHVLKDVSCTINESEICTIVGASGSGKSTLLNCLGGLDRPDSGTILVGDREVTSLSRKDLGRYRRDLVGFVFQHYALFNHMTIFENVAFGLRVMPRSRRPDEAEIQRRVHALLSLVSLFTCIWLYASAEAQDLNLKRKES